MWEYDQQMKLKVGLAEMLKGGVIMDVTTAEQAKIAEDAGAVAVMARRWRTASTMLPEPASPLVRIMAAPSPTRRSASPRLRAPHTKGALNGHLSMWCSSSAGVRTSLSSM